jgi:cytochrome c oxidase subunit 3
MGIELLSPTSTIKEPRRRPAPGGGGGGPIKRFPGGGGGGGRGDGPPNFDERLRRYRFGLALALASIVMLFITFSTAYLLRQNTSHMDPLTGMYRSDWVPIPLPVRLMWFNTFLLILSSVTMELARRRIAERALLAPIVSIPGIRDSEHKVPWLAITIVFGTAFLLGQGFAWDLLVRDGVLISNSVSGSFFYLLTGTHALHLVGGVIALLWAAGAAALRRPIESQGIIIDVTAWYWHVMTGLWLYLFVLLMWA